MSLEIERKYLDPDFDAVRRRLREMGGVPLGVHFESNRIFDRKEGGFADAGFLLRLRTQEWPDRKRHVLTLKMPSRADGPFISVEDMQKRHIGKATIELLRKFGCLKGMPETSQLSMFDML